MRYLAVFATCLTLFAVSITPLTFSFKWSPPVEETAGLAPADYATNIVFLIVSTKNINQPTNQWPVIYTWPAVQFLNQGPAGTDWTNQVLADGNSRFFSLIVSNTTSGTVSPFSNFAPWFHGPKEGVLNPIKSP